MRIEFGDDTAMDWLVPDPAALVGRLSSLGFSISTTGSGDTVLRFGAFDVRVGRSAGGAPERFGELRVRRGVERPDGADGAARDERSAAHPNGAGRVLAVGVATVDADRAADELSAVPFTAADADQALGARGWIGRGTEPALVLLEPTTEGPLAGALARHGEGPVALYVAALVPAPSLERALGPARPWPGGTGARLLLPASRWGPFPFVVAGAE